MNASANGKRVDWVDYAKGFCIVFVVMMHSTLGVEAAAGREGWMHWLVEFARPFRMPDFFMISGLFLGLVIDRGWRRYLDRKVVHFAYFYLLWMTIQFMVKAPGLVAEHGTSEVARLYILSLIEPFGTLWFIYLLPIFFVFTKLTMRVPVFVIWTIAAAAEMSHIATGWTVIDEFAARFVYFYSGYIFARPIFTLARNVQAHHWLAAGGLVLWALANGWLVFNGWSHMAGVSLLMGLAGAVAVVSVSALLAKSDLARPLRYCGRNSIVIYLAFFLPMAATRTALLKSGVVADVGTMSVIITAAGVIGALALFWAVRWTPARVLFERPEPFKLERKRQPVLQAAE